MRNIKSEKGAITILVLVTMLFMVSFLITTYIFVSNKAKTQTETIEKTKALYEAKNAEEEYNNYFNVEEGKVLDEYTNLYMTFNREIKDYSGKNKILDVGDTISIYDNQYIGGFVANKGITLANSDDFNLGSEDFTIDFWVKFTSSGVGYQAIFDRRGTTDYTGWLLYVETNSTLSFLSSSSYGWNNTTLAGVYPISNILNKWTHVAIVRYGNIFTMYINGNAVKTGTYSGSIGNINVNPTMGIGHAANVTSAKPLQGYLNEFRISKGIARWTENFTPPTPNDSIVSGDIIPIYTVEQLLKVGSSENVQIKEIGGKYYKFLSNNRYILMNDLQFYVGDWQKVLGDNTEWTSIGDTDYLFDGNGHKITVTNLNDEVIEYNNNNKYSLRYIIAERTGIDDDTKLYMSFNEGIKDDANKQTILNTGDTLSIYENQYIGGFAANKGITFENSDDFNLGSEDFTIDFWVKFTNASAGYQAIFDRRTNTDGTGWLLYVESNNTLSFLSSASTGWNNQVLYSSYPISNILNKWTHVAVVRHENVFTMYINGIAVKSGTYSGSIGNVSINPTMGIGHSTAVTNAKPLYGYLDEFRISKGIARWTENFEVPPIH